MLLSIPAISIPQLRLVPEGANLSFNSDRLMTIVMADCSIKHPTDFYNKDCFISFAANSTMLNSPGQVNGHIIYSFKTTIQ